MWRRFGFGIVLAGALASSPGFAAEKIVMFAAASLKTALDAATAHYQAGGGAEVAVSYGGSLTLARQIVAGAPADLFGSADEASMDEAVKGGAIRVDTRADVLSNGLVLIAPKAAAFDKVSLDADALAKALGDGKLATGEIATVPVGKYAKSALTKLNLWSVVEPHLATTPDVRSALAFVARGEAALGVVYTTDAAAEPRVKVVAVFPDDSHPPIRYPFALTSASKNPEAEKFFTYLRSPEAQALFAAQGFGALK